VIDYKMILLPFLISVILTPLVKQYSIYCGAYAKENKRTVHHGKISRIGGVAIYLAFIITMAIFRSKVWLLEAVLCFLLV